MKINLKENKGFAGIDISISMIIILIFIPTIFGIVYNIGKANAEVKRKSTATSIASDVLEIIKSENYVDVDVQKLFKKAPLVKNHNDMNAMLEYLDDSVEVMCKLIKIHPFGDGNGRTIRGFTNKLFEDAGLPPIYIKANERTEYHKAMNLANNENDYTAIKQFYRYKVCDSIIELDINERLKEEEKPKQMKKAK